MNIVIYGKGKAMNSLCEFLDALSLPFIQMDDEDVEIENLSSSDTIVATPGIKPSHRLYKKYHKKILSELSFLGKLIKKGYLPWYADQVKIVGITGTNGKSTTTWMMYQLLQEFYALHSLASHVHIGGNFGKPLSGILTDIIKAGQTTQEHTVILEVSSFMLWQLKHFHFDIGIFLNISLDHQDWHKDMDDYLIAKKNILTNADIAITSSDLKSQLPHSESYLVYEAYSLDNASLIGEHNKFNAGAADLALSYLIGDYDRILWSRIKGLPHRLHSMGTVDGISIIDDGISTSAHSLGTAISSQTEPFVLICGGYDNSDDYNSLKDVLLEHKPYIIVYGQIAPHIYPLAKSLGLECMMLTTIEESLTQAVSICKKHTLTHILFSPGAKSFDQFDNVYHRISIFEEAVAKLREGRGLL